MLNLKDSFFKEIKDLRPYYDISFLDNFSPYEHIGTDYNKLINNNFMNLVEKFSDEIDRFVTNGYSKRDLPKNVTEYDRKKIDKILDPGYSGNSSVSDVINAVENLDFYKDKLHFLNEQYYGGSGSLGSQEYLKSESGSEELLRYLVHMMKSIKTFMKESRDEINKSIKILKDIKKRNSEGVKRMRKKGKKVASSPNESLIKLEEVINKCNMDLAFYEGKNLILENEEKGTDLLMAMEVTDWSSSLIPMMEGSFYSLEELHSAKFTKYSARLNSVDNILKRKFSNEDMIYINYSEENMNYFNSSLKGVLDKLNDVEDEIVNGSNNEKIAGLSELSQQSLKLVENVKTLETFKDHFQVLTVTSKIIPSMLKGMKNSLDILSSLSRMFVAKATDYSHNHSNTNSEDLKVIYMTSEVMTELRGRLGEFFKYMDNYFNNIVLDLELEIDSRGLEMNPPEFSIGTIVLNEGKAYHSELDLFLESYDEEFDSFINEKTEEEKFELELDEFSDFFNEDINFDF